jgi:hypothetical protein
MEDYGSKTDVELAVIILENSGERALETYFLRKAAIELAKRLAPAKEPSGTNATIGNKSQGMAAGTRRLSGYDSQSFKEGDVC